MKPERLTTVISVLGVVLTAASVIASIAQYKAADLQAKAAVVALMPQIEVRSLLEKVDSDKYTDRRIEVNSDGGAIYNFSLSRTSWIEFKVGNRLAFQQPLIGYYFAQFPTGHTRGPLTTLKGYRNNNDFFQFLQWVQHALGPDVEVSEPVTLLRMDYSDALKQQNVYYVLVSGGSQTHLSEVDGKKLWDSRMREEQTNLPVDISKLKVEAETLRELALWKSKLADAKK